MLAAASMLDPGKVTLDLIALKTGNASMLDAASLLDPGKVTGGSC